MPNFRRMATSPEHLTVQMWGKFYDGSVVGLKVLIDTGAQVNIIRRGLVPYTLFQPSFHPVSFITASSQGLEGGQYEVGCELIIDGIDQSTLLPAAAVTSITWYEGDIVADAIVSFAWLAGWNIDVHSQGNGICVRSTPHRIWASGLGAEREYRPTEGYDGVCPEGTDDVEGPGAPCAEISSSVFNIGYQRRDVYHNTEGVSGYSPFQTVFGRERNDPGLPTLPLRECETASHFFSRMEEMDRENCRCSKQDSSV